MCIFYIYLRAQNKISMIIFHYPMQFINLLSSHGLIPLPLLFSNVKNYSHMCNLLLLLLAIQLHLTFSPMPIRVICMYFQTVCCHHTKYSVYVVSEEETRFLISSSALCSKKWCAISKVPLQQVRFYAVRQLVQFPAAYSFLNCQAAMFKIQCAEFKMLPTIQFELLSYLATCRSSSLLMYTLRRTTRLVSSVPRGTLGQWLGHRSVWGENISFVLNQLISIIIFILQQFH